MYFKLKNKNPFRDFLYHAQRINRSKLTDLERATEYENLYKVIHKRLNESEKFLNSQTAFSKRCIHWNQREVSSIKPVTNSKNPWIMFKREFENAVKANKSEVATHVSIALGWFHANPYVEDWIND